MLHSKDYVILGSILGSPCVGKVPCNPKIPNPGLAHIVNPLMGHHKEGFQAQLQCRRLKKKRWHYLLSFLKAVFIREQKRILSTT